jgi:hypothetical protein
LRAECRGQPWGSPKTTGEILLKTCKKPKQNTSHLSAHTGMARTAVVPATRRSGPLKGPLEQVRPRSRVHASLERAPPRSRVHGPLEWVPPRSRPPRTRARSCARVRAFNALTRRGGAIMRLGITPRPCCTNSQGGTHPRYCGGLCDVAGASPVTLRRLLPYG